MSADENAALVLRFYEEVWNRGKIAVADDVFAPDYLRHDLRAGTAPAGPEGQKRIAADFRSAFPDLHMVIDLLIVSCPVWNTPESTQLISPPGLVLLCAVCKVAHGVARLQSAASLPLLATNVRSSSACAHSGRSASRCSTSSTPMPMATSGAARRCRRR